MLKTAQILTLYKADLVTETEYCLAKTAQNEQKNHSFLVFKIHS